MYSPPLFYHDKPTHDPEITRFISVFINTEQPRMKRSEEKKRMIRGIKEEEKGKKKYISIIPNFPL